MRNDPFWLLKAELEPFAGNAWRTFCVPSGIRMDILHLALKIVLGLKECPQHEFQTAIGDLVPASLYAADGFAGQNGFLPENEVRLRDAVSSEHPVFYYTYDPDEGFRCRIHVESFLFRNRSGQKICCTGGEGLVGMENPAGPSYDMTAVGFADFCRFAEFYDEGKPVEELHSPPPSLREKINITAVNRALKRAFPPDSVSEGKE